MATWAHRVLPILFAAAASACGAEVGPGWTWSTPPALPSSAREELILLAPAVPGQEQCPSEKSAARIECAESVEVVVDAPPVDPPVNPAPDPETESLPRDWLSRHQAEDGSWPVSGMAACGRWPCEERGEPGRTPGRTALAILAYLAQGETHKTPRYGTVVRGGLKYLKSIQDAEGCFGAQDAPGVPLDHALATLALAEAYGMTASPLFRAATQRGVDFLRSCRTPGGGWRRQAWAGSDDPTLTAWAMAALKSARQAGLEVDPEAFEGALNTAVRITDPGMGGAEAMENAAAALWIRWACGQNLDYPVFLQAAEDFSGFRPGKDDEAGPRLVGWFFARLALGALGRKSFCRNLGGERWRQWSEDMGPALERGVRGADAGCATGSVDPGTGEFGRDYGRVGVTAIAQILR